MDCENLWVDLWKGLEFLGFIFQCCWFVCIQSWIDDGLGARVDLVGSRYARMIMTSVLIIWKGLRCFT